MLSISTDNSCKNMLQNNRGPYRLTLLAGLERQFLMTSVDLDLQRPHGLPTDLSMIFVMKCPLRQVRLFKHPGDPPAPRLTAKYLEA